MWIDYVLTYLVHSSLLLGSVWFLTTCVRNLPEAWCESLWRAALVGGVLTAGAQLALGYEPFGGSVSLPASAVQEATTEAPPPLEAHVLREVDGVALAAPFPPATPLAAVTPLPPPAESPVPPLTWLALGWGLALAALALRRWDGRRRLAHRIEPRRTLAEGPLRETLDRLCIQAGYTRALRLSEVAGLGSPIAFGTRRPEIVVPARAVRELSAVQQEAMLAHELAHHVRGDPGWLQGYAWVSGLLFFQPLNLLARRRLGRAAELLADECAVSWTGRTRELAECLTAVARWAVYGAVPASASAMAQPGSMLELRVERLLRRRGERRRSPKATRLLAILPLVLVAVFAPAVTSRAAVENGVAEVDLAPVTRLRQPGSDLEQAMELLDIEISGLAAEMEPLLDLLSQLETAPPALTQGVARVRSHLATLVHQRNVLVHRTRTSLEKNR